MGMVFEKLMLVYTLDAEHRLPLVKSWQLMTIAVILHASAAIIRAPVTSGLQRAVQALL